MPLAVTQIREFVRTTSIKKLIEKFILTLRMLLNSMNSPRFFFFFFHQIQTFFIQIPHNIYNTNTVYNYTNIFHQSIPAVPIPPGQPRGICSRC